MKYGIDINRNRVLEKVKEAIINKGHWVVDLTKEKAVKKGELVFKKVLLANITEIDYYIGIEVSEKVSEIQIYCDDEIDSNSFYKEIRKILLDKEEIKINKEIRELYLVKNINAPAVYIKLPSKYEEDILDSHIDNFINLILMI